jgi:hypothetical protein
MSMGQFQSYKSAFYLKNGLDDKGRNQNEMTLDKLDELKERIKAKKNDSETR